MLLLLIIILALLYSSFVEYCLHRFVLHSSYEQNHIKFHHKIFHGIKSYEFEDAKADDILLGIKDILLNAFLYLVPTLVIFMQNKILGVVFFIVCLLYNAWEECIHFYSHKSTNLFIVKLGIFKRLKEHHRVHHYIYNSNFGIGSTFWDVVFRTKRMADNRK